MKVVTYACSSAGRMRENNEDSFVLNRLLCAPPQEKPEQSASATGSGLQWYAVFDGMGGELYGERASFAAARALLHEGWKLRLGNAENKLRALSHILNDAVLRELNGERGGCTMAVALLRGKTLYAAHAGDSRIYLYRADTLIRLTQDHTQKAVLWSYGKRGKKEHLRSHVLMRYLGSDWMGGDLCETSQTNLRKGDRILICSDGLTDMVDDAQILRRLSAECDCQSTAEALKKDALEKGGRDNITIVLTDVR